MNIFSHFLNNAPGIIGIMDNYREINPRENERDRENEREREKRGEIEWRTERNGDRERDT